MVKKYITVLQLASETSLPKTYLRQLAKTSQIPSLIINGRLRFNPEAVQLALDKLAAKRGQQ